MRNTSRSKDVRTELLDATDRLLSAKGYKGMTIDDLAQEVGIGKGSVYLHFKSKEDIVIAHIGRIFSRVKSRLEEIEISDIGCDTKLIEMAVARVLVRFDNVQHYSQSLNEILSKLRAKVLEQRKQYFADELKIFSSVIEVGIVSGIFRKGDVEDFSAAIIDATNSLLPFSLTTKELGSRTEIERKARSIAELLVAGLKVRD
jgi:AcrR family transcriptional regulator